MNRDAASMLIQGVCDWMSSSAVYSSSIDDGKHPPEDKPIADNPSLQPEFDRLKGWVTLTEVRVGMTL